MASSQDYLRSPAYELPHDGAKEMLLVDDVEDKEYLQGLFDAMYDELPAPKANRKSEKEGKPWTLNLST